MAQHADIAKEDIVKLYAVQLGIMTGIVDTPLVYVIGRHMGCPATLGDKREDACAAATVEDTEAREVKREKFRDNHLRRLVGTIAECHGLVDGNGDGSLEHQRRGVRAGSIVYDATVADTYRLEDLLLILGIPVLGLHLVGSIGYDSLDDREISNYLADHIGII